MLITKDGNILNVTKGAYRAIFESAGWQKFNGVMPEKNPSEETFMTANNSKTQKHQELKQTELPFGNMVNQTLDEDESPEDYTVVLEDMTVKQLVEYADEQNIALEDGMKKANIIATINKAMGW